jgi:phytoene synthase
MAYKHCQDITRSRARNFYYGIRLLPPAKRAAMCALYAIARRIDDIGDDAFGDGGAGRLAALERLRGTLEVLGQSAGSTRQSAVVPPGDPVLTAFCDAAQKFPLSLVVLDELVEGCEWDIAGRKYETFDELVEYCRRVAGTVGRLSLSIYGSTDDETAEPLADALGVALQLTNILRDVVEDRDTMGRVYLPREDLDRFGVDESLSGADDDVIALVCFETGRAAEWYDKGLPLLDLLDPRSRACTAAMAGIYRRLLGKIRARPESVLTGRVRLSPGEKATVAAVALTRALPLTRSLPLTRALA